MQLAIQFVPRKFTSDWFYKLQQKTRKINESCRDKILLQHCSMFTTLRKVIYECVCLSFLVINLDIKASNFGPGNKNYERVFWCLKNCFNVKFGIVLAWDPPVENICPSSVAAYFDDKGYNVHQCHPHFSKRISYNVPVPPVTARKEDESSEYCDVLEWLGAFSVGVDLNLEPREDFLSTYSVPDGCKLIGQVAYVSWQGFFTKKPILKLLQILRKYTEERRNLCWTSMNVQGFLDSPVTWGLKEQGFFTSGDNHYTLFLKDGAALLACQVNGAQKKYRI